MDMRDIKLYSLGFYMGWDIDLGALQQLLSLGHINIMVSKTLER